MEALPAILTRRSIRKYTATPVPEEVIHDLLAAAMAAPSANNSRPWQFIIVTDRAQLDAMAGVLRYGQMLKQAPLAIVVCAEPQVSEAYWIQDSAAAAQNILVAANSLGLGGVWLGVYPREDRVEGIRSLLALPAPVVPLCVLSLGYPAEQKLPSARFDAERIHRQRWQDR